MADAYSESRIPVTRRTLFRVRCLGEWDERDCYRLLAELVSTPFRIRCPRCKRMNVAGVDGQHSIEEEPGPASD